MDRQSFVCKEIRFHLSLMICLYATSTKTDTRSVTFEQLKEVNEQINIPTVAIGGINQENARTVLEDGAVGIAVVSAILKQRDPKIAAQKLARLFEC